MTKGASVQEHVCCKIITIGALGVTLGVADNALDLLLHALLSATVASTTSVAIVRLGLYHASRNTHLLQVSVADSGVHLAVEIVGVRVVRDKLRDLNAVDKILVALSHQTVVLGLNMYIDEVRRYCQILMFLLLLHNDKCSAKKVLCVCLQSLPA